jgi:hypothetical protein
MPIDSLDDGAIGSTRGAAAAWRRAAAAGRGGGGGREAGVGVRARLLYLAAAWGLEMVNPSLRVEPDGPQYGPIGWVYLIVGLWLPSDLTLTCFFCKKIDKSTF